MSACDCCYTSGGGGGGGAGYGAGGGVIQSRLPCCGTTPVAGSAGTLTAGGGGGIGGGCLDQPTVYYKGGDGGALGSAGTQAVYTFFNPRPQGGAGGAAVTGNAYITWAVTGTRSGAINS
jgi:hypothetical protein